MTDTDPSSQPDPRFVIKVHPAAFARVPPTSVDIEQSGRWSWYGHMRAGFAKVDPPLFAFTERGIRRKARRWIARTEQAKQREHFTLTADDLRGDA